MDMDRVGAAGCLRRPFAHFGRSTLGLAFCGTVSPHRSASLFISPKLTCIFLVAVAGDHIIHIYIHTNTHRYIYIYSRLPQHWINSSKPMGGRGDAIDAWGSDHRHHLELCAPRLPSGSDASSDSGCASCPFHRGAK